MAATRPPCCPMAGCSWQAASGSVDHATGLGRALRSGHGILDRDREHARPKGARPSGHPAARWQGARDGWEPSRRAHRRPPSCTTRPPGPGPSPGTMPGRTPDYRTATLLSDGTVLVAGPAMPRVAVGRRAVRPGHRVLDRHRDHAPVRTTTSPATLLLDGTVLVAGGATVETARRCPSGATGSAELYVPAGVSPPPLAALPEPAPRSRARPRARRRSRPRPVPFRRTRGPGRSRSTTRVPSPRRCSWPRRTSRASLRLVGSRDPERGPSRRHREGDLPLSCRRGRTDGRST